MYYYVVEAARTASQTRAIQRIRALLAEAGILGEFVSASPARTVEELAAMGVEKGYTTIVAVGGGRTVNKVAAIVQGKQIALGIVPIELNSILHERLGTNDLKSAIEALKFRRIIPQNLILIEPNKYLLTQASIHFTKVYPIEMELTDFTISAAATDIFFTNGLTVRVINRRAGTNPFTRALAWLLSRPQPSFHESVFRTQWARIISPSNAPIIVENEIVAKVPVMVRTKRNALYLIVAKQRPKIVAVGEEDKKIRVTKVAAGEHLPLADS